MIYPNLKALLIQNQMKHGDLAKQLKISQTTLSEKMNGKSEFKKSEIDKIIELFNELNKTETKLTYEYIFFAYQIRN